MTVATRLPALAARFPALAALTAPAAAVAVVALAPSPAQAHGAASDPVSRVVACGPDAARHPDSGACRAAQAVWTGAGAAVGAVGWDDIRVAGVAGRDRDLIPDGRLCSAGIPAYRGLDLARADWPATALTPGAGYTFGFRETIPHRGTFRLYVTRDGYDPARPLRWADLEDEPFLTVTDPPVRDGAYLMPGRLPAGKAGRHLIYTIWRNSATADTYYSCSDVVFTGPAAGTGVAADPPATDGAAGTGGAGATDVPAVPSPAPDTAVPGDLAGASPHGNHAENPRLVASPARPRGTGLIAAGLTGLALVLLGTAVALLVPALRRRGWMRPG